MNKGKVFVRPISDTSLAPSKIFSRVCSQGPFSIELPFSGPLSVRIVGGICMNKGWIWVWSVAPTAITTSQVFPVCWLHCHFASAHIFEYPIVVGIANHHSIFGRGWPCSTGGAVIEIFLSIRDNGDTNSQRRIVWQNSYLDWGFRCVAMSILQT